MAPRHRDRDLSSSPLARAVALVAVSALAVGVIALSALALQRDRGEVGSDASAAPAPTFSFAPAGGGATASPTATPAAIASPGAAERFLARGSAGTLWRATAGACGVGQPEVEPLVERSDDDGRSWVDVTPRYRQIGQVRALSGFSGTEAEMVADLADCEPELLRTFTQGRFWEPYPDLLAAAEYLTSGATPDAAATLQTPAGTEPLPCVSPWSLRVGAQQSALVCDGTAHLRVGDGEWSPLPVADARAVDVVGRESAVAHRSTACPDGVGISMVDADGAVSALGCVPDIDATGPIAIAAFDEDVLVWAGDTLTALTR